MDTEISYAGILRRVLASVIDGVLLVTIILVTSFFLYFLLHSFTSYNDTDDIYRVIHRIISTVIIPLYIMFNMQMITRFGGTSGKLLCGIYIKDASTFTNVTLKQTTKRYALSQIPVLSILGCVLIVGIIRELYDEYIFEWWFLLLEKLVLIATAIAIILIFVLAILDKRKQTFYDKIVKTVVISYKEPVECHLDLNYVGIARRIIAYIIDCFTNMGICLVFFSLARIAFDSDGSGLLAICLYFLLSIVFGIFMVRRFSGTPGQLLCGIHIKDINTLENITLVQATTRYISSKVPVLFILNFILIIGITSEFSDKYIFERWILPLSGLVFIAIKIAIILIFISAAFDQRKQTFYDKIARTVVIDYKPS
ncbi:MAG: hypothetical protein PG978_001285 [Wolbachia endosymbiont of Ctenocephalides felis wCfeF]|nr:MAG: hypothetical protein PG978_001285 [Wolbachia endosymbiont of Ctenocephalides felis wCfeF]